MQDGKYVILCVDDDQDVLDGTRMVLQANGYVVAEAHSGEEAVSVYKDADPDLLIVDLMMEEVDAGVQLVKELKLLGNTKPIYMLSSVGDGLHQSVNTIELGLAGVLQKPVDGNAMLALIQNKLK